MAARPAGTRLRLPGPQASGNRYQPMEALRASFFFRFSGLVPLANGVWDRFAGLIQIAFSVWQDPGSGSGFSLGHPFVRERAHGAAAALLANGGLGRTRTPRTTCVAIGSSSSDVNAQRLAFRGSSGARVRPPSGWISANPPFRPHGRRRLGFGEAADPWPSFP